MTSRAWIAFALVAGLLWHALSLGPAYKTASKERHARDFASYYLALQVARDGGNPYDASQLTRWAHSHKARRGGVYPYFYPPPFLLAMTWASSLDLQTAYRVWFWLDEALLLLSVAVLWRWWRPLGGAVPVALAATLATLSAIPNNHLMGQANFIVLAAVLCGLWLEDEGSRHGARGYQILGGALVGLGCMLKMSPAFFVLWWLLRRRWTAVGASLATAVVLTLISLPLVGFELQRHFYIDILPSFGSGNYNGLPVDISMFGNHSLPNLYYQLFDGRGKGLGDFSQLLANGTLLAILAGLGALFWSEPSDELALAGQISSVAVAMLLVPVYTYEHHVVWAIPAAVVAMAALARGRLPSWWAPLLAMAWVAWCFELMKLKGMFGWARANDHDLVALALQEMKCAALIVFFAASVWVGRSR